MLVSRHVASPHHALRRRFVSADFVRDGAALGLVEMVRGGTTCVNDMYFFNESLLVAARAAGVRVTAGLVLLDFPTAYAPTGPDEYLAKAEALVKANAAGDESMIRCAAVTSRALARESFSKPTSKANCKTNAIMRLSLSTPQMHVVHAQILRGAARAVHCVRRQPDARQGVCRRERTASAHSPARDAL
jgi:hypothetical protein